MPITLPTLRSRYCTRLTVCVRVVDRQEMPKNAPDHKNDARLIAESGSKTTPLQVSLLWDDKKRKQFHVDIVKKGDFSSGESQATNSTPAAITKILDSFSGATIDGIMFGRFKLPISKLGETSLVRSSFFEVSKDEVEIKLVKGTIVLRGTPVKSLEWQISRDAKTIAIDVNGWVHDEIFGDDFLTKISKNVDHWFRIFVLGEGGNDSE
jgi:hypothetical protein